MKIHSGSVIDSLDFSVAFDNKLPLMLENLNEVTSNTINNIRISQIRKRYDEFQKEVNDIIEVSKNNVLSLVRKQNEIQKNMKEEQKLKLADIEDEFLTNDWIWEYNNGVELYCLEMKDLHREIQQTTEGVEFFNQELLKAQDILSHLSINGINKIRDFLQEYESTISRSINFDDVDYTTQYLSEDNLKIPVKPLDKKFVEHLFVHHKEQFNVDLLAEGEIKIASMNHWA
jgi:hypothetical protein